MADKFLQHDGVEVGYFAKRRDQFRNEISKGLDFALNRKSGTSKVTPKKKHNTAKQPKPDQSNTPKNSSNNDEYRKKVLENGRIMHFKGNQLVSKKEYDENVKET